MILRQVLNKHDNIYTYLTLCGIDCHKTLEWILILLIFQWSRYGLFYPGHHVLLMLFPTVFFLCWPRHLFACTCTCHNNHCLKCIIAITWLHCVCSALNIFIGLCIWYNITPKWPILIILCRNNKYLYINFKAALY